METNTILGRKFDVMASFIVLIRLAQIFCTPDHQTHMCFKKHIIDFATVYYYNIIHFSGKAFHHILECVWGFAHSAKRTLGRSCTDLTEVWSFFRIFSSSQVGLRSELCAGHSNSFIPNLVNKVLMKKNRDIAMMNQVWAPRETVMLHYTL